MSKDRDMATLAAVVQARNALLDAKVELKVEAAAWVERKLGEYEREVDNAVLTALEDGHSVTKVADAYTVSRAETPNRVAVYRIINEHKDDPSRVVKLPEYPFEWAKRRVRTASGSSTVYDIHVVLNGAGPKEITGEWTWRWDALTSTPEQVITDGDPYPESVKHYKQALQRWLIDNPYPGKQIDE